MQEVFEQLRQSAARLLNLQSGPDTEKTIKIALALIGCKALQDRIPALVHDSFFRAPDAIIIRDTFQALHSLTRLDFFEDWRQSEIEYFPDLKALILSIGRLQFSDAGFPGIFYEQLVGNARAKKQGIFYTPTSTAVHMVRRALAPFHSRIQKNSQSFFLLDPSCGGGIFLLESFREIQKIRGLDLSEIDARRELIEQSLHGVDLDPVAIEVSKLSLLLELYCREQLSLCKPDSLIPPNWNLFAGNSLLDPEDLRQLSNKQQSEFAPLSFQKCFPAVMKQQGFDLVIGNPPYGLARGQQLSELENSVLLKRYADYRDGKLNKYLLFMARGLELLKPNGRMCYIVPNSWLGIRAGRKIRSRFLKYGEIESIESLGADIFREPSLECVIFVAQKHASRKNIEIITGRSSAFPSCESCLRLPDSIIPLQWSAEIEEFFAILHQSSTRLEVHPLGFQPLIALQAYALGRGIPPQSQDQVRQHCFHSKIRETECHWPYFEGRDISRYSSNWSGLFLSHGAWLAEPQRLERFRGPRVVIREITAAAPNRLIATYFEDTALYNKSVLHILPSEHSPLASDKATRMKALLAILNSKLGSLILSHQGRKIQRKLFPKIVNDDLKDFPIPSDLSGQIDSLAGLASKRLALSANQILEKEELENQIDHLVFRAYQMPESLIQGLLRKETSF